MRASSMVLMVTFSVAAFLLLGAMPAQAETIDMEGVAPVGGQTTLSNSSVTMGDWVVSAVSANIVDHGAQGHPPNPDNGSDWLLSLAPHWTLSRVDGAAFTPVSFDASEYLNYLPTGLTFGVSALVSGVSVAQLFHTDDSFGFQTFTFTTYFQDIVLLDFVGVNLAFDNIVVNEASMVPEPTTLALLGLGIAGLMMARRRRRVA